MFPLLLSVSHSLPLPLIVHPALFIEHWKLHYNNYRNGLHGHVYNYITPQNKNQQNKIINKQRLCVVLLSILLSLLPIHLSLISNNHFRLSLGIFPVVLFVEDPSCPHTHTDDTQHSQFSLFQFLFGIFFSLCDVV
jgi:hypothetical protein